MASVHSGQGSLLKPNESNSVKRPPAPVTLTGYALPPSLEVARRSLNSTAAGIEVFKVSKLGRLQGRRLAFSPDHRTIYVTTNRIKSFKGLIRYALPQTRQVTAKGIDISMIDHLQKGQMTKRFRMAKKEAEETPEPLLESESTSLSIVYRTFSDPALLDGCLSHKDKKDSFYETLDLVVPSPKDYGNLVTALEDLMDVYRQTRTRYDRTVLLLQHHWIDMGKDLNERMSMSEWTHLCDKLNAPLKKYQLTSIYRELNKDLNLEDDGLPLWLVAELLNDVKYGAMENAGLKFVNQDPLLRLWNDVMGTDPVPALKLAESAESADLELHVTRSEDEKTISAVAFLSFIRSQQKAFKTTLEDTLDIVHTLNDQISVKELAGEIVDDNDSQLSRKDRLTKSRFISYLLSDSNDLLDPALGMVGVDDMTRPLSHYWINSSHDTYVNTSSFRNSNHEIDDLMYQAALYRGVRCLELDVWDGVDGEPIISREAPKAEDDESLKLTYVLRIVRNFLLENPKSYPVLLNIENHCSYRGQEKLASLLMQILGAVGLIVVPDDTESLDDAGYLPSPASMIGKVLIMGKRPKVIKEGAFIVNDDFDDENDEYHDDALPNVRSQEEEHEIEDGIVIGFDAAGPIRSLDPSVAHNVVRHSPGELLYMAQQDADRSKMDAAQAELKAVSATEEAKKAEDHAVMVISKAGLTTEDVYSLVNSVNSQELDPVEHVELLNKTDGEGVEVQEFFGETVEGAKLSYTKADAEAIKAAEAATYSLQKLNAATESLREVESVLEKSYSREREVVGACQRAAADARSKREHADAARRRVEKVRQLLKECRESAASAENVVVTAMTEAKISEKRAAETEARAARAQATAQKDRLRADEETKKEEVLEQQAGRLHEHYMATKTETKEARDRVEKAVSMLEKVNEQIKLIEQSSQYQRERKDAPGHIHEEKNDVRGHRHSGKFIDKHAAKLEERELCIELIQQARTEHAAVETRRRKAQDAFEQNAHRWKQQADLAAQLRKQADRSAHTSEELAEHAEEEREAAILRHSAREKAQSHVTEKDSYKASLQAQFVEAERAAKEAHLLASEAREKANLLAVEEDKLESHESLKRSFEKKKARRDAILADYEQKKAVKEETETRAIEAKRLFDTSSEVLSSATRDAAEEMTRVNVQRLADRNAIVAFNRARLARGQADHALEVARLAQSNVTEKESAIRRAIEYKEKTERIAEIPVNLAKMTFLHTTKHRYWQKSLEMPCTHTHSFSQGVVDQMMTRDPQHQRKIKEFTSDHICRTFPSWKETEKRNEINFDPIYQWAIGCQLVSMNLSTYDENVVKNDGRFRSNGSCGYVLKPSFLTGNSSIQEGQQYWKISILCGSCLPPPEVSARKGNSSVSSYINPFVKISIYDASMMADRKKTEYKTRVVQKNGLNPVWDDKGFSFSVLSPTMSIIVFTVWDKQDNGSEEIVGSSALPVSCMREGYRSVALFDMNHTRAGPYAYASLFVRAEKVNP